jgi:hypothetical protein
MTPNELIDRIKTCPDSIEFPDVISVIDTHYRYTPVRFSNGTGDRVVINEAGSNEGSCKIFAFAQLNGLDKAQTLACFGQYYRNDVLQHPDSTDHMNIRNFMVNGWDGISFDGQALINK